MSLLWINFLCIHEGTFILSKLETYDILPNGPKAALTSSVVISGLRSPTKTWKWSIGEKNVHSVSYPFHEWLTSPPTIKHITQCKSPWFEFLSLHSTNVCAAHFTVIKYMTWIPNPCTYYLCLFSGWLALWPSWLWLPAERGRERTSQVGYVYVIW